MFFRRKFIAMTCFASSIGMMAGCADRPPEIPSTAQLKTEGSERVVYVADHSGTVWISDQASNKILYSSPIRSGDRVVLDPDKNDLMLNDRVVLNTGVSHAQHKIFFESGERAMAPMVTDDRNITRPAGVPTSASLKGEGKDRVEYTADTTGTLWITDVRGDKVIYSGRVMRGDRLVIDPGNGDLTLNGSLVGAKGSIGSVDHRVFFQPGDAIPASASFTPGTIVPPDSVPSTAVLRSESVDTFEVRPDSDGTVWVVSISDNRVIYSGRLLQGDRLSVDAQAHRLTLNGNEVSDRHLPKDRYRVYFLAGGNGR